MRTWCEEWKFLHGLPREVVPYFDGQPFTVECDEDEICNDPVVSVIILIYNHEKWLDQCIESVVGQETDFAYEVLLCEDRSTDASREICRRWLKNVPNKIRIVSGDENLGVWRNIGLANHVVRGRFLACVEGDDYWTDPRKLQKQVDLALKSGYRFVVAWNKVLDEKTGKIDEVHFPSKSELTYQEYKGGYYHTSTFLIESALRREMDSLFRIIKPYDTAVFNIALKKCGRIGVLNEYVSVYRRTGGGIYTGADMLTLAEKKLHDVLLGWQIPCSDAESWRRRKHGYCCALCDYIIHSNYQGRRSVKLLMAVGLVIRYLTFSVNASQIMHLFLSVCKSFVCAKKRNKAEAEK